MDEWINKKDIIRELCLTTACSHYDVVIGTIMDFPSADVRPVKRGKWELTDNPSFRKCSECGAWWSSDITGNPFVYYCPTCGAKMDLNKR